MIGYASDAPAASGTNAGAARNRAGNFRPAINLHLRGILNMRIATLLGAAGLTLFAAAAMAQSSSAEGPYHVIKKAKVGGEGGFDYVYADSAGRKLYVPRSGADSRVVVYDLD